jgi:hypothetical protein
MLKDVSRLISFRDVVYYVGDQLFKRSLRYTWLTAAVSLLGYLGNFLPGFDTYNAKVAIALPLVVGSSMLLGGFLLKTFSTLLASRAMNVAEAQDLDLMEDYRKSHEAEHLEMLWQRVFRFEWSIGSAAGRIRPHPVEAPPEVCLVDFAAEDPQDLGRQQFLARARFALARPQSQPRQRYHVGIDLRFLEDWYNGACFDRQDVKLVEQYDGSATLDAIKRELDPDRWAALEDLSLKLYQKFWFRMITRAVGIHVGEAITWLNRRYDTDYFNAQALLWPGEDDAAWVQQFPLAAEDIRDRRRAILVGVFSENVSTARRVLRRMLWPSCWLASKLRAAYDPQYVAGSLGCDLVSDLEEIQIGPKYIAPYRELARQVEADQSALTAWLQRYRPELAKPDHAESLRAARIAVHVRRDRLRAFLRGDVHDRQAGEAFVENVVDVVDQAVRARERYTACLVGLRIHHELTRLHYREYMRLLDLLRDEKGH